MSDPRQTKTSPDVGAVLLPYQQRWIADDTQLKIAEKSRRIGLTWAEAADNVGSASRANSEGGQNVYYISANQDMGIEYIEACAGWAKVFNHACDEIEEGWWEDDEADQAIKTFTIKFPSGRRIVALTSRPANLRGKQGIAVIDEGAFHQSLPEMLKAALAFLIWGGKVRIISTHDGDDNPFNEFVQAVKNGTRKGSLHRVTFKEAVAEGLYKRVCLRQGIEWTQVGEDEWVANTYDFYGDGASEELDVIPKSGSGGYLSGLLIDRAMVDMPIFRRNHSDAWGSQAMILRTREIADWCKENLKPLLDALDNDEDHVYGLDYARLNDLTVIWPLSIGQDLRRRTPFIIELRNCPKRQQHEILDYISTRLPRWQAGALDATGSGEGFAEDEQEDKGIRVECIKLSDAWYGANMPAMKQAFQDNLIQIPRDADIRKDLLQLQEIKGIPKIGGARETGKDGFKRHGDSAIALCLAWYASQLSPVDVSEAQAVGQPSALEQVYGMGGEATITETGFGTVGGDMDMGGFF